MIRVVVVGPRDTVTAAIGSRLADSPEVSGCLVVHAPGPPHDGAAAEGYAARLAVEGIDVAVYRPLLPGRRSSPDPADAVALLAAWRREAPVRPRRVVLLSSAAIYDPRHDHPGHVEEGRRPPGRNPIARAWAELEALFESRLADAGVELVVLRPVPVVARDVDDWASRLFAGRRAFTPAGHDPSLQILSPEDLAEAVCCAVLKAPRPEPDPRPEVYHVAPDGVVPVRAALRLAGTRRLPLGHGVHRLARAAAARLGLAHGPHHLDYIRYPWTVSNRKAKRELGFAPRWSSAEALLEAFGGGRPKPASLEFDDFGMDPDYIAAYGRTLFRFLHRHYWRIEVRGIENVPRQGRAVLAGVHRGFMPWDGVMALHTVRLGTGRILRFLIHPGLIKFPFLANYMTKLGGIPACQENAEWVLGRDELLGFFPEGIRGAFTMYKDAYRLGKFGRDEFVKMALRNRAPIVPFVTTGSAEIFPILGKIEWAWWKRQSEWPFLPITPTFPLLPVPLPSKWHTQFLAPIAVHERYGPEAADDPAVVRAVSREVRARMEEALADMLARRRSIFYGSIWAAEPSAPAPAAAPPAPAGTGHPGKEAA